MLPLEYDQIELDLHHNSANPGTASEGDVYFNSSDGGLRAYDGSAVL